MFNAFHDVDKKNIEYIWFLFNNNNPIQIYKQVRS